MKLPNYVFQTTGLFTYINNQSPLVTIQNGTLRGLHDGNYNHDLFLGIPYAKPPISNQRFRAPQPYDQSWTGTRDAIAYGYSCPG